MNTSYAKPGRCLQFQQDDDDDDDDDDDYYYYDYGHCGYCVQNGHLPKLKSDSNIDVVLGARLN